jgi:hypothetical protein
MKSEKKTKQKAWHYAMQYKTLRLLNVKTFLLYMLFSLLYMVPSSLYGLQFHDGSCFCTRYFHLDMCRFHLYMWRFHFYMWRFFPLYRKTQTHHMQRTKHHIEWNKDTIYCGIFNIQQSWSSIYTGATFKNEIICIYVIQIYWIKRMLRKIGSFFC